MSTSSSPENAAEQAPAKHPVALIAGPTASGKSDLAIRLAKAIEANGRNAAIVNADSAQVYADLRVVSARPSRAEMDAVEHRLFGAWDGAQPCSAADWARAARAEIDSLHAAGTVPILVGGTGMYIRTLLDGIASIPAIDPAIRDDVRSMTAEAAYAALQAEDPQRADILAPGDRQRVARALEVVRSTGRPLHAWQKTNSGGIADRITLHPLILLPERDWLYNRCDSRFEAMLASGAIEEVEALLARKLDPALPIMRAIGVPEIASWLRGETSRQVMIAAGQQATRNYAKRQYTWFRRQAPQHWPRLESQNYDMEIIFNGLLQN